MSKITKYEFQYVIWIRFCLYPYPFSVFREILNELQVQFIIIASSKTRQLTETPSYTVIFRAPPRAMRMILQRKNDSHYYSQRSFLAFGAPQCSTPRSACRFAASNDSHCYSTRFLRLGERAPSISDCEICKKKENLGAPNGAQRSSFLGDTSP